MLSQSYGMLTSRAGIEFNKKVRTSQYANFIKPCNQIHDALYYLVKDDIDSLLFINKYLVKAIEWQDDPNIADPDVHLTGNVSIFYPDWAHELELPHNVSSEDLIKLVNNYLENLNGK